MPTSSSAANVEKRRAFRSQTPARSVERSDTFLTIESALPSNEHKKLTKRSYSTLNASALSKSGQKGFLPDPITIETGPDGISRVLRTQDERTLLPDRLSLDRRGLNSFPLVQSEPRLRLLSLQHNLITSLDALKAQSFPYLVFLDVYDNQLEQMVGLEALENLRVLLLGKNRIKKIEGLVQLRKIEVLDLHGNQIGVIQGLEALAELKVLNLAGNQLRYVGPHDFFGLAGLQELNLRRNKLRKLMGFGETPALTKLFISNNDLQSVEDISSLAKSTNLKEVSVDCNPVSLSGDCTSFLVSYLPHLVKLNAMPVTEQVRKAGLAWRRNKETTNTAFMDLTSDVCLNVRREETISNARTNWELLRTQTKCLTSKTAPPSNPTAKTTLSVDSDLILTSLTRHIPANRAQSLKKIARTSSQDTDNSQTNTSSSSEYIRLPPILVPIIKKIEAKSDSSSVKGSVSSVGPAIDSATSSSNDSRPISSSSSSGSEAARGPSTSSGEAKPARAVKSATNARLCHKWQSRAATAKAKRGCSPKDREQGGDYLIEISGRYLNIYGQCALRFIDKTWSQSKANDVTSVKFHYVNFNTITSSFHKLKLRFPHIEHFYFKETNITYLGQLNALAEIQGLSSLCIDPEGNPIMAKEWRKYAIFRLAHWGLVMVNEERVTEEEVKEANEEYKGLGELALASLPEGMLQPLLARLRLDVGGGDGGAKRLLEAEPELKAVVSKEALQWRKTANSAQEDQTLRSKAKTHISQLLDEMGLSVNKLRLLDEKWPIIMNEFVRNALVDYSQLDLYMKQKMLEAIDS